MKLVDFLNRDIWHLEINKLSPKKAFLIRFLRVIMLTTQGFTKNQIQQGASALTYYSLLAIVPIIALLIGIARGFLFEHTLESWLLDHFKEQSLVIDKIIQYANASLEKAKGGVIALIGVAILVWAGINILTNIELVMNQIWEVKKGRSLPKRFTDYFAMLFLTPIMVLFATALTGYLSALLTAVLKGKIVELFSVILIPLLSVVSFLLVCLLFTFLYIFMPNTRVRFVPALIAGIFAGVIYQFLQWLYFYFQIGVASYNAIYGTFAAVPLFLIWLHLSWLITLIGAKLAFAIQNVDAYEFITEDEQISHKTHRICSLRIAHLCIKRFMEGKPALSRPGISNALSIPHHLTNLLVFELISAGLLVEIRSDDKEETYQPARSVDDLTIKKVIDMIDENGSTIPFPASAELSLFQNSFEKFSDAITRSDGNLLLKNI